MSPRPITRFVLPTMPSSRHKKEPVKQPFRWLTAIWLEPGNSRVATWPLAWKDRPPSLSGLTKKTFARRLHKLGLTKYMNAKITTWVEFKQRWDGVRNFLMGGECIPFEFRIPPLDRVVDLVRRDEMAEIG